MDQVDQDRVDPDLEDEVGRDLDHHLRDLEAHHHLDPEDHVLDQGAHHHHSIQIGDPCLHHHLEWVDLWDLLECPQWDQWGLWDQWVHQVLGDQWEDHQAQEDHQISSPTRTSRIRLVAWT